MVESPQPLRHPIPVSLPILLKCFLLASNLNPLNCKRRSLHLPPIHDGQEDLIMSLLFALAFYMSLDYFTPCNSSLYVILSGSLLFTVFTGLLHVLWECDTQSWLWCPSGRLLGQNMAKGCFLCLMEFENYMLVLNKDQLWNITAFRICSSTIQEAFSPLFSIDLLRICMTMMLLWPNMQTIVFRKVFPVEGKKC